MFTHKIALAKIGVQLLLGLAIACTSLHAQSAGWIKLFKGTPVENFDDEDLRRMLDAVKQVLSDPKPDDAVPWKNDATGSGGEFKVVGQPMRSGFDACRRVKFSSYSKQRKGYAATWTACKDASGKWSLISAK
jgi:surface antigen